MLEPKEQQYLEVENLPSNAKGTRHEPQLLKDILNLFGTDIQYALTNSPWETRTLINEGIGIVCTKFSMMAFKGQITDSKAGQLIVFWGQISNFLESIMDLHDYHLADLNDKEALGEELKPLFDLADKLISNYKNNC